MPDLCDPFGLVPVSRMQPPAERLHWIYYDSVVLSAAIVSANFFVDTAGKTIQQSNLRTGGGLPTPQYFGVSQIGVGIDVFSGVGAATVANQADTIYGVNISVLEDSVLRLIVSNKTMYEAPLWFFPPGGGVYASGLAKDANATAGPEFASVANNGVPGHNNRMRMKPPVILTPNEEFRVEIRWGHGVDIGTITPRIYVFLHGVLARGIN